MYTIDHRKAYYIEELEYLVSIYIYIYTHSYLVYDLSLCSARKSIEQQSTSMQYHVIMEFT